MKPKRPSLLDKLTSAASWLRRSQRRPTGSGKSMRSGLFGRFTLADAGQIRRIPQHPTGMQAVILMVGAVGLLLIRTAKMMIVAKTDSKDTWRMAHRFTNGSATFVIVAMCFVGMIMVYQSTEQLSRAIGDTQLVGAAFLKLLVRVLGPTVIGMLLACRVGAGIAAEIGAMAVTDQLDAMRVCSADPIEVLMVPRLRGGIIASVSLVIVGTAASAVAGMYTGKIMFGMSPATYWNLELITFSDVIQGTSKAVIYGIAIPIISGSCGLSAFGGAQGVGRATTNAVVGSSFAIVVLDSLVSLVSHVF